MNLFQEIQEEAQAPLSERWRPCRMEEIVGQEDILSPTSAIGIMIASRRPRSIILWGPPGSGKTTIARILPEAMRMRSKTLSGSVMTAADLKAALAEAEMHRVSGMRTFLVVEEIHRVSRSLQDQLLRPIESGLITLVGCTTEHVAYEIVDALLSRVAVVRLRRLDDDDLHVILSGVEKRSGRSLPATEEARKALVGSANGDARRMLGNVDMALDLDEATYSGCMDVDTIQAIVGEIVCRSDKDREMHYDRMSAMQKAVRSSDPDAALFWFSQMVEAGEDMEFVMRRMLILANEEIGLADPQALVHCVSACDAYRRLGDKAGLPLLAQAIIHMACSPKSNAAARAYRRARSASRRAGDVDPNPISINHPTADVARSRGYVDDHETEDAFAGQDHWPRGTRRGTLYVPNPRGLEATIGKRLERWSGMRSDASTRRPALPGMKPE